MDQDNRNTEDLSDRTLQGPDGSINNDDSYYLRAFPNLGFCCPHTFDYCRYSCSDSKHEVDQVPGTSQNHETHEAYGACAPVSSSFPRAAADFPSANDNLLPQGTRYNFNIPDLVVPATEVTPGHYVTPPGINEDVMQSNDVHVERRELLQSSTSSSSDRTLARGLSYDQLTASPVSPDGPISAYESANASFSPSTPLGNVNPLCDLQYTSWADSSLPRQDTENFTIVDPHLANSTDRPREHIEPADALEKAALEANPFQIRTSSAIPKKHGYARKGPKSISKAHKAPRLNLSNPAPRASEKPLACLKCSLEHKKCKPGSIPDVCERCEKLKYRMSKTPCVRMTLGEITLFRTTTDPMIAKPYRFLEIENHLLSPIQKIDQMPSKIIGISQGIGTGLYLRVEKFGVPQRLLNDLHAPGKHLYSHRFCFSDLDETKKTLARFVNENTADYIKCRVDRTDQLTMGIFTAASKRAQSQQVNATFLADVLRLWTSTRMMEGGWNFCTDEVLGLDLDGGGAVPFVAAPFIDYEYSAIMVQGVLYPLQDRILKRLHEMTHAKKSTHWFDIFLAMFIMLHSYELLMNHQRSFARRHRARVRYSFMPLIRKIHISSKILLTHFHHMCKGQKPFEVNWKDSSQVAQIKRMAQLDSTEMRFLEWLAPVISQKIPEFKQLVTNHEYETSHWFTGQLFLPEWTPPSTLEHSPLQDDI